MMISRRTKQRLHMLGIALVVVLVFACMLATALVMAYGVDSR